MLQGSQPPPREVITAHNTPEGTPSYERSFKSDTSPSTSCSQAGQTSDEPTCTARSGGEVRQLGMISADPQYEENGQRSDAVNNFPSMLPHPFTGQRKTMYPNAKDPTSRIGRRSMASFLQPEQTVSLHRNNLNELPVPAISGAEDADVCTVPAVKNEWGTTPGTSRARFSGGQIVGKTLMSVASEKDISNGKDSMCFLSVSCDVLLFLLCLLPLIRVSYIILIKKQSLYQLNNISLGFLEYLFLPRRSVLLIWRSAIAMFSS